MQPVEDDAKKATGGSPEPPPFKDEDDPSNKAKHTVPKLDNASEKLHDKKSETFQDKQTRAASAEETKPVHQSRAKSSGLNAKKANRDKANSGVSDGQSILLMFYTSIPTIHALVSPALIKELIGMFAYLWNLCAKVLLLCVIASVVASRRRREKPQTKKEEVQQIKRQYPQETKKVGRQRFN